ncbi:MAG: PEP-CTERM sorting domain-containing protein [Planctomycetota bacterium]
MHILDQAPIALRTAQALVAASALAVGVQANATSINYGDFSGSTVMYLDVTETANSPGDTAPLFGAPSIAGDQLDFDPAGFSAASTDGVTDLTDGQLNFTLMATGGATLEVIEISESGDYTLFGSGTSATQVGYGLTLASVVVTEVDGVAITPVALSGASVSSSANLADNGPTIGSLWSLGLSYDVDAALAQAGVDFVNGATKLEIALDNTLIAVSEDGTAALVAKKDLSIDVEIPEPGSLALLSLGGLLLARRRRG